MAGTLLPSPRKILWLWAVRSPPVPMACPQPLLCPLHGWTSDDSEGWGHRTQGQEVGREDSDPQLSSTLRS